MRKIVLIGLVLVASLFSVAFAGNFYMGPTFFLEQNSADHSQFRGLHPRLSLGYGSMLDSSYYLAGELTAVPGTVTLSDNHSGGAASAKTSRSLGASILPGMMMNDDILGYLRFGVINSKFSSPNVSKTGLEAGLGFNTGLAPNWVLRGEFIHIIYGTVSTVGTPYSNQVGLGLICMFDSLES